MRLRFQLAAILLLATLDHFQSWSGQCGADTPVCASVFTSIFTAHRQECLCHKIQIAVQTNAENDLAPAQVVDRMVAVVNKRVILESELDQAARVEFLLANKPISSLTQSDRATVLDRLIERALLDQQIVNPGMLDPTPQELAARVKEVRDGNSAAGDEQWKALLAAYGLTQEDLEEQLTSQVRILRFIDLHFRGLVRVEKSDVEAYYQEKFLPELRKRSAPEPALAEVSGRIEQILVEQRIDDLLNNWLKALRSQAHIEKMVPTSSSVTGAAP